MCHTSTLSRHHHLEARGRPPSIFHLGPRGPRLCTVYTAEPLWYVLCRQSTAPSHQDGLVDRPRAMGVFISLSQVFLHLPSRSLNHTAKRPPLIERSPITTHPSPCTTHHSPLTPHSSPLTPHPSPLTFHHSPLTTHHSPLPPQERMSDHPGSRAKFPPCAVHHSSRVNCFERRWLSQDGQVKAIFWPWLRQDSGLGSQVKVR